MLVLLAVACGDDSADIASPSVSPSPESTTVAPTPTAKPNPTATPDDPTFSGERAFAIVQHLGDEIGTRFAGSPGEAEAAEYMRGLLESYGYEARIQTFQFETVTQLDTELILEMTGAPALATVAMGGTATGIVERAIVTAGIGRPEEFPANSDGKIALIERGELTFAEKALNAQAAGAVGVVIYNNEDGPFVGRLDEEVTIPVVSMPQADGQILAGIVASQTVSGTLSVDIQTSAGESRNVIAEPPAGECRMLVGGHFDSVANGPGANDNGSGTAVAIEMARAMAADGEFDDVCFALFGAEEIGLLGSIHYVANLTPAERSAMLAMLNFDMLGVGNGWPLGGSGQIVETIADEAQALGLDYFLSDLPANVGSDHAAFIEAGIDAVIINCFCDPNYHTSQDAAMFIDPDRLQDAGDLGIATIEAVLGGS